jgi:hypothetical protein
MSLSVLDHYIHSTSFLWKYYLIDYQQQTKREVLGELIARFPLYVKDHIENDASNKSDISTYVHCGGNVYTDPLPSNDKRPHM